MGEKRESFVFYASFFEALQGCPSETRLAVYEAIIQYALYPDYISNLTGIEKALFTLVKPQLDANIRRRENGKLGASFGKKGGRPKKENPTKTPKKPQENPTETPNVNVNDNVNVNVNDNVNNNNINVVDVSTTPRTRTHERFQKPTVEEVDQYIREKGYTFDAEAFVSYYESNGWKVGRNPMKDWRAACRTWQGKEPKGKKTKEEEEYDNYYGDGAYKRAKELQQVLDNLAAGNS